MTCVFRSKNIIDGLDMMGDIMFPTALLVRLVTLSSLGNFFETHSMT